MKKNKSIRLNSILRSHIVNLALFTSKRILPLAIEYNKQKALIVQRHNKMLKEYYGRDLQVLFRHNLLTPAHTIRLGIYHYSIPYFDHLFWQCSYILHQLNLYPPVLISTKPLPEYKDNKDDEDALLVTRLENIKRLVNESYPLINDVRYEYKTIIENCSTTRQLFDYWPKGENYMSIIIGLKTILDQYKKEQQ